MNRLILKTSVSALALFMMASPATAQTVIQKTETYVVEEPAVIPVPVPGETITTTTRTMVTPKPVLATNKINFDSFDRNNNGILSMAEVGEHLFYLFDTDGNEVIDNIEFNNKRVITIAPMEKHTLRMVDIENADGTVSTATYNYETFYTTSGLTRFDADLDGLSPAEFIDNSFLKLDTDSSKAIELDEWKSAYIASRAPLAANQDGYNN